MSWEGDLAQMGQLGDRLADLARIPSRVATAVAGELAGLVQEEFDGGHDPYGRSWEPHAEATVERWGEHPILDLTGDMRKSVAVRPLPSAGVGVTIAHPAAPHQTGWSGPQGAGPAREILPAREMPADWDEAIEAACDREFKRAT